MRKGLEIAITCQERNPRSRQLCAIKSIAKPRLVPFREHRRSESPGPLPVPLRDFDQRHRDNVSATRMALRVTHQFRQADRASAPADPAAPRPKRHVFTVVALQNDTRARVRRESSVTLQLG